MRIGVVRLSALGDVVLTAPALSALRRRFPDAEIELVTAARFAGLFDGHPALTRVLAFEPGTWAMARLLRGRRYDVLVDLQNKPRTALWRRLANPARRVVLRKRRGRDWLPSLLGRPLAVRGHAVDLYAGALEALGVPPPQGDERRPLLVLPRAAGARADAVLAGRGLAGAAIVALAPGAAHGTKRWGAARFAALASRVRARGLGEPLAVGGPGDEAEIAACGIPAAPLDLELPVLAALLGRCRVLVAGDTGLGHLAAAVGTPVVSVFGPTAPARWAPLGAATRVVSLGLPCAPCSDHGTARCPLSTHACMRDLTPELVEGALAEIAAP